MCINLEVSFLLFNSNYTINKLTTILTFLFTSRLTSGTNTYHIHIESLEIENLYLLINITITGVEISEFVGYDLGLKAVKPFSEGSLVLTVPRKVMMTENDARESSLSEFIVMDPLLQNMPNITLALFLLLEKNNPGKINFIFYAYIL